MKDWMWIKDTKYYEPFQEAMSALEEFKTENPMIKQLFLNDCDFGHERPCGRTKLDKQRTMSDEQRIELIPKYKPNTKSGCVV